MVTLTGQPGISQVTRDTLICMSHRRRRRSETAFLWMNKASAIGCLSLRICSPYRLFVLYHRSITAFAKRTKTLPPLNTLARRCWNSRRSFGFTFCFNLHTRSPFGFRQPVSILQITPQFVVQAHSCTRNCYAGLTPAGIPIPWHTYIHSNCYIYHLSMLFSGRNWVNNLLSVPLLRGTVLIRKAANLIDGITVSCVSKRRPAALFRIT